MYNLPAPCIRNISVRFIILLWCDAVFCFNIIEVYLLVAFQIMVYYALGIFTPMQTMWIRLARWQKGIKHRLLIVVFSTEFYYLNFRFRLCVYLMGKQIISLSVCYCLLLLWHIVYVCGTTECVRVISCYKNAMA